VLSFDGVHLRSSKGQIGTDEARLLDSLIVALPENIFWLAANGAVAIRFLGGHFRATDFVDMDYSGPYSDLFAAFPPASPAQALFIVPQQHIIALDSGTQLLTSVSHAATASGSNSDVQTQLSNWILQDGQWFPQTMTRVEGGRQTLQFSITSFQVKTASSVAVFQN